ncbi:MAG: TolC family protein [Candidatus Kapaibacterium sp.]|nr:MAG: TolC family protein [Candidatus Kapabacteria bacterium]
MNLRYFLVFLCCLGTFSRASAQFSTQFLSLKNLEEQALKRNLGLLSGRLDFRQAEADIVSAGLRPNPVATLNADILPLPGERFSPNDKQYGLSVALPIELGNKREYRLETAQNLALVQKSQLYHAARQTLLAVRLAFFDVLGAQEQVAIASANRDTYQKLVALNGTRFKAAQISQTELSRSELAFDQAELQRRETELTLAKAERALLLAVGNADNNERIVIGDRLQALQTDTLWARATTETFLKRALEARYDVQTAKMLRSSAEANQRLQEANALPDVSIAPEISMQQNAVLYGFTGVVPLPFNNRNEGERQKAQVRIEQTQRQISLVEYALRNEVQTAAAEYEMRQNALQRYRSDVSGQNGILSKAANIKSASEIAYKAGSLSLLELLDAVRVYNEVYKSYIDALTLFNKSVATLTFALGSDAVSIE